MYRKLLLATMVSVALYGCGAEERAYEYEPRAAEQISKSSLDTESLWLYMPSTGAAPRYAATQRGFFQGTPKLVTLRFDQKNGIIAEEVDRDTLVDGKPSRYDSSINLAPVLKIPGEFQQYRCAEDQFDECTNKEELNTDASLKWEETTHFTPDYTGIKSLAVDTVDAWWTADNVTESADPRLVHWEYDADAGVINVEVERTFTADADDMYQFGSELEDLSFKTRFFYSLVKLDKLASKDYEVVHYPGRDSQRYGFFNQEKTPLSTNGEADLEGEKYRLINRFNPKKASIDYYLSDSYFTPEGREFLETTINTIDHVNEVLAGTGVPTINIVNKETPAGKHPGDLRINMFNLITDPVDNGLLGYGPSATNPLTGEIVHAHVNQYAGVIRASAREMWRRLTVHYNRQEIARPTENDLDNNQTTTNDDNTAASEPAIMTFGGERVSNLVMAKNITNIRASLPMVAASEPRFDNGVVSWLRPDMQQEHSFNKQALSYAKQFQAYAEQNMYSDQFLWVSTQSKGLIKGIDYINGGYFDNAHLDPSQPDYADKVNTKLKAWEDLNADQQAQVTKQISQHIYTSTLVHELGHNLGLRHNFMGSMDKNNFYSEQEITALGYDKVPAYSSIMDYGASIFDELPTYGKYDIAALRFGYNRQAEVNAVDDQGEPTVAYASLDAIDAKVSQNYRDYPLGTLEALKEQLAKQDNSQPTQSVKNYYYCTDENTSSTTTCNRFDEGTNILELTKFRIQRYWDSYDYLNKRNGRDSFYESRLFGYTVARLNQFNEIREVVEDLGEIDYYFAQLKGEEEESYGQNVANFYTDNCQNASTRSRLPQGAQMICDTFDAALLAADFFVEVMAQPDHVCEIEVTTGSGQPLQLFSSLNDLWAQYGPDMSYKTTLPESCFDKDLVAKLASGSQPIKVLSETRDGRPYSDMRANNPNQIYSSAIDLMGIWPDKLLAAQTLVQRNDWRSSRDKSNMALMDVSDVRSGTKGTPVKMKEYLGYIGYGATSFRGPVFVDENGESVQTKTRYLPDLRSSIEVLPYYDVLKGYFQLSPTTVTPLFNALLTNLVAFGQADEYGLADSAQHLIDDISIRKPSMSVDLNGGYEFSWKTRNYMVTRRNGLAKNMALKAMLIDGRDEQRELLENSPYTVKQNLRFTQLGIRTQKDATLYLLRDTDAVNLLKSAVYFESLFRGTPFTPAKFAYDSSQKCYYPAKKSADEGCHNKDDLLLAWQSINENKDSDPEYLEALLNFSATQATEIAAQIADNPEHAKFYAIPAESIWLWSTGEYRRYRRAIEQLPLMD
ncbi:zinc-dependent metalloprotease [Vibrio cidicii]|uniref:zinc-dependent metalloprotease n=1 Tax=Vibrio cidicii TaxID=1763883 RepID=UPI001E518550|nr:zinc-dependent metalloprotease [Vibrio cidicii]